MSFDTLQSKEDTVLLSMSFVKEMILTGDQIVVKTDIYILVHVLINTVSIKFFIYYTVLFYVYHYYTAVLRGIIWYYRGYY